MTLSETSCFILTDIGAKLLDFLEMMPNEVDQSASAGDNPVGDRAVPQWDPSSRELWLQQHLLKRFQRPAPVLELLLTAFQEMGWPARIDDPLPPESDVVPQERLRDSIRRLNRCQNPFMIHFMADGSGRGIRWELMKGRNGKKH